MRKITLLLLQTYKIVISPVLEHLFGHACRYTPTCSEYAGQAVERYGVWHGLTLAFGRVIRCNPFLANRPDPVS